MPDKMTPETLAKSLGLDGYCDFDVPDHCRTHCSPRDAPDPYCNGVMWWLDLARCGISPSSDTPDSR